MSNTPLGNSPIDKGRVAVIVEKYPTNQVDQNGQPIMKNRYANIGRATLWPSQQYSSAPNVEVEIDALPIGHAGKLKMYIFWESDNPNNQPTNTNQQQAQPQYQPPQHQQQNTQQRNSYGTPPNGHR